MQDAYFVDTFSCEDAFAEEVLIDVGDGTRVDIEASLAGVERSKARARCRGDADAYARLQNAVALGDDAQLRIDDGLVERVRHRADHAGCCAARKLRVGVECDDISNVLEHFKRADLQRESYRADEVESC